MSLPILFFVDYSPDKQTPIMLGQMLNYLYSIGYKKLACPANANRSQDEIIQALKSIIYNNNMILMGLAIELQKTPAEILATQNLAELLKEHHPTTYQLLAEQIKMLPSHQLMLKNVTEWASLGGKIQGTDNNDTPMDKVSIQEPASTLDSVAKESLPQLNQNIYSNILKHSNPNEGTVVFIHYDNLTGLIEQLSSKNILSDCLFVFPHRSTLSAHVAPIVSSIRAKFTVHLDEVIADTQAQMDDYCSKLKTKLIDMAHISAPPTFVPMQQATAAKPAAKPAAKSQAQTTIGGYEFMRGVFAKK